MQTEHLSDSQCTEFREQRMPTPELERAGRHLAECAECRLKVLGGAGTAQTAALLDALGDSHIEFEELEAYLNNRLPMDLRAQVIQHLGRCERCQSEADDLAQFARSVKRAPLSAKWYVTAAAVMVAVGGTALALKVLHRPDAYEAMVTEAKASHIVTIPGFVTGLRGPAPDVRGDTGAVAFHVIEPVGTALDSDTPRFAWTALAEAKSYTVDVFDANLSKVATSGAITGTTWTPDKPLPRAQTLQWQVTSSTAGGNLVAPSSSERAARFFVLDAEEAATLERARREHAGDTLLLALLYARAGVLPRAMEYLKSYAAAHPGSDARALIDDLRAQMIQ